jgi:DNA-binding CsgD family transcriptional regulator
VQSDAIELHFDAEGPHLRTQYQPSAREQRSVRDSLDAATALDLRKEVDGPAAVTALLQRVTAAICEQADLACIVHRPVLGEEGGFQLAFFADSGFSSPSIATEFEAAIRPSTGSLPYDPIRPRHAERNRVLHLDPWKVELTPSYRAFLPRFDLYARTHTRVLLCDGPRLLAWFGIFHQSGASDAARAGWILRAAVARVRPYLRRMLGLSRLGNESLGSALFDALPGEAYLLGPDGRIEAGNALGAARLRSELRTISVELRESLRRPTTAAFELHSLDGAPRQGSFLAVRRPVANPTLDAKIRAAQARWRLTRAETVILRGLARGAANKDLAEQLQISLRTVEAHVKALLRKSESDSRMRVVVRVLGEE